MFFFLQQKQRVLQLDLEELYRWHFERNINHIFTCTCLVIVCLTCWQLTWVKNINGLFQKFIFQILLQLVQSSPFPIYKNNLQHSSGYDSCRWRAKVIQAFDGLLLQFGSSDVSQWLSSFNVKWSIKNVFWPNICTIYGLPWKFSVPRWPGWQESFCQGLSGIWPCLSPKLHKMSQALCNLQKFAAATTGINEYG